MKKTIPVTYVISSSSRGIINQVYQSLDYAIKQAENLARKEDAAIDIYARCFSIEMEKPRFIATLAEPEPEEP
jgi:hypothetical protein